MTILKKIKLMKPHKEAKAKDQTWHLVGGKRSHNHQAGSA